MKLNTLFLSVLLVPFAIVSVNDNSVKIENLKKNLHEKELELTNLSKAIEEKEIFIDSMTSRERALYSLICETSSDSDAEVFKEEVKTFQKSFNETGFSKENIKEFLLNKSLDTKKDDEVERIKAWLIRYKIEYFLLKKLIKSYEECLRELLEIEIQLEVLQK